MRKWTYLVAGLLICGTAATVTSCIDNEEPAGITDLRGAKAELLRAKAQVQVAEAEYVKAQANLVQAKADLKAEEVAQAKLQTDLMAAQTEDAKKAIEEAAAIRAEKTKAALLVAQQAALEADYAYQKALAEINLQLSTLKNDVYVEALKNLLEKEKFTYSYYEYTYEKRTVSMDIGDEKVNITYYEAVKKSKPEQVEIAGFISLSKELANVEYEIMSLLQNKAEFEFSYKTEDLQKKYAALKAYWEGKKEGTLEVLESYKKIQGIDIAEWEASYKALDAEIEAANVAKDAIDKKLAEDLVPLGKQRAELENKFNEISELKIEVPVGMERDVTNVLWQIATVLYSQSRQDLANTIYDMVWNQTSTNANGDLVIANNAFTVNLSADDKNILFNTYWETGNDNVNILKFFENEILSAENEAQAKRILQKYETNLTDATKPYTDALVAWEKARDAFIAAADKYKYDYKSSLASHKYDAYATIKATIDAYLKKTTPTAAETTAIKTAIANFLTQRAEIDGFELIYKFAATPDEKDVTMQAALKDATESDAALASFINIYDPDDSSAALGSIYLNRTGGLYKTLYDTTKELWGEVPVYYDSENNAWNYNVKDYMLEPISYKAWKARMNDYRYDSSWYIRVYQDATAAPYNPGNVDTWEMYVIGDGLANDYFVATFLRDNQKEAIDNNALYEPFLTSLKATYDANRTIVDDYNAALYALSLQKAELENAAKIENAKYEVIIREKQQLQGIMEKYTVTEAGTTNSKEFEQALQEIKNKIIEIEGGVKENEDKLNYNEGLLAEIDTEIAVCDNYLKAIADKTYPTLKDNTLAAYELQISLKEQEKEILQALYNDAKAKKDKLLEGLAGGSSTPAQ